ncbi:hypothetical protein [Actinomadura rudentiformis]|uniref:Uncharacterized protein n=1 Tax=Actinomadura rudentiformis TaxID=359158 RepID=A0A6H9YNP3_9ACTN|nr:hypothetical protein [Actinomadura rudentiformis]KAB2341520.1 hypothetical protein F8566_40970 [Actinomadura rudentiformis]
MTIAHHALTGQPGQVVGEAGSPTDLDLRRQLREAREELWARREQEAALRETAEALFRDLKASHALYVEMHVAYVELLTHARAAVAAASRGEVAPTAYIAGYLEEIGLQPAPGAVADAVVAEGLALAVRLSGGEAR